MKRTTTTALAAALGVVMLAACSGSDDTGPADGAAAPEGGETVTLVTHNSFAVSDDALQQFSDETDYRVKILRVGDGGVLVNQAVLTAGNPQGDVLFGVDNTLLSRALDAGLFVPHEAAGLDQVPEELQLDSGEHRVTPVDTGDICVNYDRAWFEERDLAPPETFEELADPAYRDLLVVQNPATSTPGLGFLLGTAAEYGDDGWQDYWQQLADNGVEVVEGWEQAYYEHFSGSGGSEGDRPLVVSYASSPPAEVLYGSEENPEQAPTGVSTGTCFRQIEFAGLLDGAPNPEGGKRLLDFLLSPAFQEDVPLEMFVNPARADVELPEVFTTYGEHIEEPRTMDPQRITENREQWVDEWTSLVVG
ncbi:thiamine ABC transporter substrate-binding protein [Streptomyces sp. ACA25]|uniref:thiamine ABC transporter substrate-binding protein n=1 Tax=Streptomyces sp. ACA25 TaxID=3022596 RepID=UPI0023082733|nr:thiamine ABC transporter substrate-binding protein [Streptomyces sp. ACA25]MDB1089663.1 thiamine ABC transporter substrate-binding protein [Streptomyces sp. ACA25]